MSLALPIFLACAVEAVEALTVVLAVGTARGWRWTLAGAAGALLTLALVVGALGPALLAMPLQLLRLLVGLALLTVGVQWLRKAILRAAGRKALHDETAIYQATARAAEQEERRLAGGVDRYALSTSYVAVLLEGAEVVAIVLSFAASGHGLGVGIAAAGLAVVLVALAGVVLRAPLARVPENTLKMAVGIMLVSFGVFWLGEGAGLAWPAGDATLLVLAGMVALVAFVAVRRLQRPVAPAWPAKNPAYDRETP
jgi:uncharacterized membrane protein